MKTVNRRYQGDEDLEEFIAKNSISQCENILLQVFTGNGDVEFIRSLVVSIKKLIPHINIIGTTTSGEIIEGEVTEQETILSFSMFEQTKVMTYFSSYKEDSYTTAQSLIKQFDKYLKPKVAISFVEGLSINGEPYLKAFNAYDETLIVAGGLAGDNGAFEKTTVFTQDEVLSRGAVVALLYNDNLVVNTEANHGWINIGKTLTITKSEENVAYEIDNMKAIDLYVKYLGDEIVSDLPSSALEFPLLIKRDGFNIARAMISRGDDGSLVFAGNIGVGDKVTFGYGNIETIMQGENRILRKTSSIACESIFIYSCMARKTLVGEDIALELQSLSKIAPMSGWFTYGEFYSNIASMKNELLNQTMTVLSLSESTHLQVSKQLVDDAYNGIRDNRTLKALARLISETSYELEKVNSTLEIRVKEEVAKNIIKEKQLLQQSRFAQMGEMISMIAHQWRQPLNAISLTTVGLELKVNDDNYDKSFFQSRLKRIAEYVQHLSSTIEDFRNFFKPDKAKQETTFSKVIENALSFVSAGLETNNIRMRIEFNCKGSIFSYPNELLQVALNLIKNAEDVLLEKKIADPQITIRCYSDADKAVMEIEDNAGGVDESIIDQIFEPYFTTKNEHNGTGLGLYMSKIIIEEHCDGVLSVSNNRDGAVFKIVLSQA